MACLSGAPSAARLSFVQATALCATLLCGAARQATAHPDAPASEHLDAARVPRAAAMAAPLQPLHLSGFAIDTKPHLIGTLTLYGVLILAEGTVKPLMAAHLNCRVDADNQRCDAGRLWAMDKSVVGQNSARWRHVSDWGNIVGLGGAVVATLVDSYLSASTAPLEDAATDVLVMAETVGVATLVTHTLKYAIRRPRPGMYAPGRYGIESELSFPSGHTTAAASGCAAYATSFALRHPTSPARYGVALAGVGITALTAYGRVAGGMHFYTDVLAGALVGGAIGYLLPQMYARGHSLRVGIDVPQPLEQNSRALAVSACFAL